MDLSKLRLDLYQVIGNDFPLVLLGVKSWLEYVDGNPTGSRLGTTYEVIQNGGQFCRFSVKIREDYESVTADELEASKEPVVVEFENALCSFYVDSNRRVQLSCKADSINVL